MLKSKPIGANQKATERWEATNRMTIEIFKAFWQRVSPDLEFPWTQAGDDASHVEWGNDYYKFQGTRMPGGAKQGIVRAIKPGSWIREETYFEDKLHGLSFAWTDDSDYALQAIIWVHGKKKAVIYWNDDWSERHSWGDKELILENNGLSNFKP